MPSTAGAGPAEAGRRPAYPTRLQSIARADEGEAVDREGAPAAPEAPFRAPEWVDARHGTSSEEAWRFLQSGWNLVDELDRPTAGMPRVKAVCGAGVSSVTWNDETAPPPIAFVGVPDPGRTSVTWPIAERRSA